MDGVKTFLQGAGVPGEKLTLIPGFFDQSLPALSPSALVGDRKTCLVAHVDCDLYDSAVPVFKFISPLVQTGTWLLLDDYWCFRGSPHFGVRRAFEEWLKTNGRWGATEYASYNGFGKAFILHELAGDRARAKSRQSRWSDARSTRTTLGSVPLLQPKFN
jgi:hypothetical protein